MQILCSFHFIIHCWHPLPLLSTDDDTANYLYDALTAKDSPSQRLVQEGQITAQAIRGALQELGDTHDVYEERVAAVWAMFTSRPRTL